MTTANLYIDDLIPAKNGEWRVIKSMFKDRKDSETTVDIAQEKNEVSFLYNDKKKLITNTSIDLIKDYLSAKIYSIIIPRKWKDEDISSPTIKCKEISSKLVIRLFDNYEIIPDRSSATIEGGIFLLYIDFTSGNRLSIEVYNDLDIAAIITNNKKIIKAFDIDDETIEKVICTFQER
ncbi:MAG TPA: hypothetical protein ENI15_04690 [Spirochaetes bacterium]|nr:hypothetical protein [Spirochaetota bacterium]